MKSAGMLASALVVIAGLGLAQAQSGSQTVSGYLVDVMCATEHAKEGAAYGEKHDKSCLLMDGCVKSGYSVLTADRVLKFDARGSTMALELIRKTDRKDNWRVEVVGEVSGDTIAVTSLRLQ